MSKHAYLIISHNQPELLKSLVSLIDDKRNDIYVHIDLKSDINLFQDIKVQKSRLTFIPRIKVAWGDISQIKVELALFEVAVTSLIEYDYYHLLSGVDLPLKNQDYIHSFFEKNKGSEFLGFAPYPASKKEIDNRTKYHHVLQNYGRIQNTLLRYSVSAIKKFCIIIQKVLHIQKKYDFEFRMGTNWCSVTKDFAHYIVSRKENILKMYRKSICCDEVYKQTLMYNSPFYKNVFQCENQFHQCLREIDWNRGSPYIYTEEDYDMLIKSENLFARKFSEEHMELINKLKDYVLGKSLKAPAPLSSH